MGVPLLPGVWAELVGTENYKNRRKVDKELTIFTDTVNLGSTIDSTGDVV